jgi:pentatricopeptide repeat protein
VTDTGGGAPDEPVDSGDRGGEDGSDGEPGWFGVRCVFRWSRPPTYEERITLWQAASLDDAIARAEQEAAGYAERLGSEYLEIAQAYWIGADRPEEGSEVFSLMRDSDLEPDDYLDAFYDTGNERQRTGA